MKPLLVPVSDVNSQSYKISRWHAGDETEVLKGHVIAEVETSKSVIEITAPENGFVLHSKPEGGENAMNEPVAYLFQDKSSLSEFKKKKNDATGTNKSGTKALYRATAKAEALAAQYKLDLSALNKGHLITEKEVDAFLHKHTPKASSEPKKPMTAPPGIERVLLIGGGLGATQVLDIFKDCPEKKAVAILDDNSEIWNTDVCGVPVMGGSARLEELFKAKVMDRAIISISTSIEARTRFRKLCQKLNIPLANAIDRTVKIGQDAKIGEGNVICAFCHFGAGAVVGDNNFISVYNSFDHHCKIGSDLSTGPGCMTSGVVTIGDRVRMGTGIFIQPYVEIGDDVRISSGAVILQSVPSGHAVKTKVTTTILPI